MEPISEKGAAKESIFPKGNTLHRFIARFIDLLVVAAIAEVPLRIRFVAAVTYLLLSDGFSGGRSVGKRLIGLRTVVPGSGTVCTFKESILRNFPLALAVGLFFLHWLTGILSVAIFLFEGFLIVGNDRGLRLGDEIARTQVIDGDRLDLLEEMLS